MLKQKPIRDDKWKIWFSFPSSNNLSYNKNMYLSGAGSILSQMKDWGERGGEIPGRLERAEISEDEEMSSVITLASTGHK